MGQVQSIFGGAPTSSTSLRGSPETTGSVGDGHDSRSSISSGSGPYSVGILESICLALTNGYTRVKNCVMSILAKLFPNSIKLEVVVRSIETALENLDVDTLGKYKGIFNGLKNRMTNWGRDSEGKWKTDCATLDPEVKAIFVEGCAHYWATKLKTKEGAQVDIDKLYGPDQTKDYEAFVLELTRGPWSEEPKAAIPKMLENILTAINAKIADLD